MSDRLTGEVEVDEEQRTRKVGDEETTMPSRLSSIPLMCSGGNFLLLLIAQCNFLATLSAYTLEYLSMNVSKRVGIPNHNTFVTCKCYRGLTCASRIGLKDARDGLEIAYSFDENVPITE